MIQLFVQHLGFNFATVAWVTTELVVQSLKKKAILPGKLTTNGQPIALLSG
jgi:hypothetical protein